MLLYTERKTTKGLAMSDDINKPAISTTVTGSCEEGPSKRVDVRTVKSYSEDSDSCYSSRANFAGEYETIRDAYENSPWFREFIYEIINMYGFPVSSLDCETQQDKIMFSWAMLHVTSALEKERGLWYTLFDVDDPVMTADFFCRTFYEKRKDHVIPSMPSGQEGLMMSPHSSDKVKSKKGNKKNEK